jgi:tRNA(fMet)-specific endonuclease VapC
VAFVIDTDVVSYLYKQDTRGSLYRRHLSSPPFNISFMTLAELRRWTLHRNWGTARRLNFEAYLARYRVVFAGDDMCELWAQAMDSSRRARRLTHI